MVDGESNLDQFLSRYKYPLAMGIVGGVLLLGGILSSGVLSVFHKTSPYLGSKTNLADKSAVPNILAVDVSGEVSAPGVYKLPAGARVEEAIKAAGGVTEKADPIYLSKSLNLAQKLTDGMKIYIPQEKEAGMSATGAVAGVSINLVNLNEASLAELDNLPGVGEVTAQNIIGKRPYGAIEELLNKKVVSKTVFEKIKDKVSVY